MLGMRALLVLSAAGGLALYQMTSLVLGPAGNRELHLSLAIPSADADEPSDAARPGGNHVIGTALVVAALPAATASSPAHSRLAQPRASATPAAAPVVATSPTAPVPSEPAAKPGKGRPQPPKHHDAD
jgi:cell division septation protein DedD